MDELQATQEKKEKKPRKPRKPVFTAEYPNNPTGLASIDLNYIKDYLKGSATPKERKEMLTLAKELIAQKGNRHYFMPFRQAFAEKYFPALVKKAKDNRKREGIVDFLEGLEQPFPLAIGSCSQL